MASARSRHSVGRVAHSSRHDSRVKSVLSTAVAVVMMSACSASGPTNAPAMDAASTAPATGTAWPSVSTAAGVITIGAEDLPSVTPASDPLVADAPARIAALAIGVGETIEALGAGPRVVARDEASSGQFIDAAPVVTKGHALSAERVLATQSDLAIVDASTSPPEAIDQLRAAGVRVVEVPQAWSVSDMPARIRAVGAAVGASPSAITGLIARLDSASPPVSGPRPKVAFLYLRGSSAIYLLGGRGSGADDLIERAGGVDVGAGAGLAAFTPLTAEALAAADPEILLVMSEGLSSVGGIEGLREIPGVAQTSAGREGSVVVVDDTVLLSFGPRTPALIERLAAAFRHVAG